MSSSFSTRYAPTDNPTVFGKILRHEIPAQLVYEDDHCVAFPDIAPKAPIHIIIIPKQHLVSLQAASPEDTQLLGHLLVVANLIAAKLDVQHSGYRLITNAGAAAGQEVPHLHFHLLAPQPGTAAALPGF